MKKFIPYEKLSKRKRREADGARRQGWGQINPVTRKTADLKAYDHAKARRWRNDDPESGFFDCENLFKKRLTILLYSNMLNSKEGKNENQRRLPDLANT